MFPGWTDLAIAARSSAAPIAKDSTGAIGSCDKSGSYRSLPARARCRPGPRLASRYDTPPGSVGKNPPSTASAS